MAPCVTFHIDINICEIFPSLFDVLVQKTAQKIGLDSFPASPRFVEDGSSLPNLLSKKLNRRRPGEQSSLREWDWSTEEKAWPTDGDRLLRQLTDICAKGGLNEPLHINTPSVHRSWVLACQGSQPSETCFLELVSRHSWCTKGVPMASLDEPRAYVGSPTTLG